MDRRIDSGFTEMRAALGGMASKADFDRLEAKVDGHSERIDKLESGINFWPRFARIMGGTLAAAGTLAGIAYALAYVIR